MTTACHAPCQPVRVFEDGLVKRQLELTEHFATGPNVQFTLPTRLDRLVASRRVGVNWA